MVSSVLLMPLFPTVMNWLISLSFAKICIYLECLFTVEIDIDTLVIHNLLLDSREQTNTLRRPSMLEKYSQGQHSTHHLQVLPSIPSCHVDFFLTISIISMAIDFNVSVIDKKNEDQLAPFTCKSKVLYSNENESAV